MKTSILAFCSLAAVAALSATAFADDTWNETVAFSRSDASSIRITEPEGYTVSVNAGGQVFNDTVPANIKLPTGDNFYAVTLTSPKGASWTKKIEVKRYQITDLKVKHTPAAATAPAPTPASVRSFVGSVYNKVATCGKQMDAKFEFIDAAGNAGPVLEIKSGRLAQTQLPTGTWSVRAYTKAHTEWTYQTTQSANIQGDDWTATLICPDNQPVTIQIK